MRLGVKPFSPSARWVFETRRGSDVRRVRCLFGRMDLGRTLLLDVVLLRHTVSYQCEGPVLAGFLWDEVMPTDKI